jgi:NAD(P)-dependent dehydrogenase (short-subunit alcohol dehydrogenase family)
MGEAPGAFCWGDPAEGSKWNQPQRRSATLQVCGRPDERLVNKEIGAEIIAGEFAEMLKKLMALPRYSSGDEIAGMVAYLAGPEAGFVTGASLTIDGGFTA